jgi:hypothetical protein
MKNPFCRTWFFLQPHPLSTACPPDEGGNCSRSLSPLVILTLGGTCHPVSNACHPDEGGICSTFLPLFVIPTKEGTIPHTSHGLSSRRRRDLFHILEEKKGAVNRSRYQMLIPIPAAPCYSSPRSFYPSPRRTAHLFSPALLRYS